MRKFLIAVLFVTFVSMAGAATTRYVNATNFDGATTFSTLSSALTTAPALTHGDTVIFTDSATYTEAATVTFSASVSVFARAGCNPTITNGANNVATMFLFNYPTAGGNMQFGSLLGADNGRITILYQKQAAPTASTSLFKMTQYQYKRVTFQNLSIYETGAGYSVNVFTAAGGSGYRHVYVTLSYVDIDINVNGAGGLYNANTNFALGVTAGSDTGSGTGIGQQCVWTLDHVRIKNFGMCALGTTAQGSTFNMAYCDFGNLGQSVTGGYPYATVYNRIPNCQWKGYIDHCIFRAPAGNANFMIGGTSFTSGATSVTLNRCVLIAKPTSATSFGNLYLYSHQATPVATGGFTARVALDHCDIVDLSTGFDSATYAAIYRPTGTAPLIKHNLILTNNNIYSARNRAINIVDATNCTIDALTRNNNVIGNVGAYGTAKPNVNYAGAPGDLSLDPVYTDAEIGDVRYANATLKTGDTVGGPIGSMAGYVDAVDGITSYTLTYTASLNGTTSGTTPQTVNDGDSGTAVEGIADPGYHFFKWNDNVLTARRVDANVKANKTVAALFATTYTLTYTAGANGSISGTAYQVVNPNDNGTSVSAIPAATYHFVSWSDGNTNPDRTDLNVNGYINVTATFAKNTYTLTYQAVNGTITGTNPQVVNEAANATTVTAVADTGYHFNQWEDGILTLKRRDMNVQTTATHTATFDINQYTLTYGAGEGGSIDGSTTATQTVNHGSAGSQVTAIANTGYHFVQWSDGVMTASRTDSNVTGDATVTATFAINEYSLNYSSGGNGSIIGQATQTVTHGGNGSEITAQPDTGYHFANWSDGWVGGAVRTDTNVTTDITAVANFAINTYQVQYVVSAFGHGSITGQATQTVNYGGATTAVTASPESGYHFKRWVEDLSTNATRSDSNIMADATFTAEFEQDQAQYTLTYNAGPGGTIDGVTPQTVDQGTSGTKVTAVPNAHYHFVKWSDNVMTAERLDTNVNGNIDVTAEFAIDSFTLKYIAGANGTVDNQSSVTLTADYGTTGAAVTAVPNTGYHFLKWDDENTSNPRRDVNVTTDVTATAMFEINTYTVHYIASSNGSILGDTNQTVAHGSSATQVTALPDAHYHFLRWSDGSVQNPRTDTNVLGPISVSAEFEIDTVALTYTAGANGSLQGNLSQLVNYGENGTTVTAVAAEHYHFKDWSDGSVQNPRRDINVTTIINVTARFELDTYTLTYTAGSNGSIVGDTPQTVSYGLSGTAVTAVPADGYHFVKWSDDVITAERTDENVTGNISVTATFASGRNAAQDWAAYE